MVVTYGLLREIDEKKRKIEKDPDYYLKRAHQLRKNLRGICDIHSFFLEHPELRARILKEHDIDDSRKLKQVARGGVQQMSLAWSHLISSRVGNDYKKYITAGTVIDVGSFVEPTKNQYGFRSDRVLMAGLRYVPPNPIKVPDLIEHFCANVTESDYHPVEAAAVTHLTLTGIQPLNDGNKRTARLLQDKILWDYGLPPAYIPSGERAVYVDLLEQALLHQDASDIEYRRPFFDYIAGKVNVALDNILDDLKI